MSDLNVSGLLISAGLSRRMGEFKPLMNYKGESFVVSITRKLIKVCDRVVVVTGFKKEEVELELKSKIQNPESKIRDIVYNPDFSQGMFTSLKTGLKYLKDSDWVLYHFVDQPFHSEKFYEELISQVSNDCDWIQPVYKGKEGHPILFNKKVIDMVIESPNDFNLRVIRNDHKVCLKEWECNYPEIIVDLDTPEDIKKLEQPNLNG